MSRVQRKPANRGNAPRKSRGGMLLGVFIGLVIGLVIAAVVAWYIKGVPAPFQSGNRGSDAQPSAPAGDGSTSLPGKPGDGVVEAPRYDFYNILPGKAGAPPAESAVEPPAAKPAEAPSPETLFLQAGAFSSPQDADNLKARLALMGLEALVSPTQVPDKGTLYRVRIGPYAKVDDLNATRAELARAGVEASVVKGGR